MPSKDHDIMIEIATDMKYVKETMDEIKCGYVKKTEFLPVKLIAYGLVGSILITVIGALLAQVVKAVGF